MHRVGRVSEVRDAIMNKLKQKYSDRYDWVYPEPGDWHIMKTAS